MEFDTASGPETGFRNSQYEALEASTIPALH
jgi:hypothetical protein